ncbi:hypothetical protein [Sphingobium sp. JAI105]|uniref:hypothetical protein n=1 Tax=Sphingobium sp. JAI105 TaxID=2787715 RepID=UPI0018C8EA86|nr:hypothetical protein [Sphingobium sp. JAI105]
MLGKENPTAWLPAIPDRISIVPIKHRDAMFFIRRENLRLIFWPAARTGAAFRRGEVRGD